MVSMSQNPWKFWTCILQIRCFRFFQLCFSSSALSKYVLFLEPLRWTGGKLKWSMWYGYFVLGKLPVMNDCGWCATVRSKLIIIQLSLRNMELKFIFNLVARLFWKSSSWRLNSSSFIVEFTDIHKPQKLLLHLPCHPNSKSCKIKLFHRSLQPHWYCKCT